MNNQCYFAQNNIKHIDYKDVKIISKFITPSGRMMSGRRTNVSAKMQRQLSAAIKRARFMSLMPYIAR